MAGANANAIEMGGGYVQLFTDNSAMVRGLKNARNDFDSWAAGIAKAGAGLAAVGAVGFTGGAYALKQFADAGGALDDISQRTGASVESLSRLAFAAQMGGSSIEAVEGATKKLQKRLSDAVSGNKEAANSFFALGLSAKDLMQLPLDQQMAQIGNAITAIDDPALRASAAMDVFGKSGSDLIPMFNGLSDAVVRADELGLTWTAEDAERAAELGDRIDELTDVALRTVQVIGSQLAPIVMGLSEPLLAAAVATKEFVAENPGLVEGIAAATVVVGGLGVSLVGAAAGLTILGTAAGTVATVLGATLSPIAIPAAIVGLGYVVETQTGIARKSVAAFSRTFPSVSAAASSAMNTASNAFGMIAADAKDAGSQLVGTWRGIVSAVSAGDLELAGEVAMAGLNAAWYAGTITIRDSWDTATAAISSTFEDCISAIKVAGEEVYAWFSTLWSDIKGLAFDAFDGIVSKWNAVVGAVTDLTIDVGVATGAIEGNADEIKKKRRQSSAVEQESRDSGTLKRQQQLEQERRDIETNRQAGRRSIEEQRIAEQQRIADERDAAIAANQKKVNDAKQRLQELKERADKSADDKKKPKGTPKKDGGDAEFGKDKKNSNAAKSELQVSGLAASLTRGGMSSPEEQKVKAIDKTTQAIQRQESAYDALSRAADEARMAAVAAAQMAGKTAEEQIEAGNKAAAMAREKEKMKLQKQDAQPQKPVDKVSQPTEVDKSTQATTQITGSTANAEGSATALAPTPPRNQPSFAYEAAQREKREAFQSRQRELTERQRGIGVSKTVAPRNADQTPKFPVSPQTSDPTLIAEAERLREERKARSEVKTMRPVRPDVNDGIGQSKAIAAQVASERQSGNQVVTNRGNIANIIDFAEQNTRFEERKGTVRRVPDSLPIPDLSNVRMPDITSPDRIGQQPIEVKVDSGKQEQLLQGIMSELKSLRSVVTATGGLA